MILKSIQALVHYSAEDTHQQYVRDVVGRCPVDEWLTCYFWYMESPDGSVLYQHKLVHMAIDTNQGQLYVIMYPSPHTKTVVSSADSFPNITFYVNFSFDSNTICRPYWWLRSLLHQRRGEATIGQLLKEDVWTSTASLRFYDAVYRYWIEKCSFWESSFFKAVLIDYQKVMFWYKFMRFSNNYT